MNPSVLLELKHKIGMNCIMSSVRSIMETAGHVFSEDFIYGLGAGLNFWFSANNDLVQIAGVGSNLFGELQATSHIHHSYACFDDDRIAREVVCEYLDHGIPVICDVELITYLPHMINAHTGKAISKNIPNDSDLWNFRVGGHMTLLAGYDSKNVFVYENMFKDLISVPHDVFSLARNKKVDFIPSQNGIHTFIFPKVLPPLRYMVDTAIRRVVHNMYYGLVPPAYSYPQVGFYSNGLQGLEDFFAHMETWSQMEAEALYHLTYTLNQVVNRFGNSEVNRITYSRFLREASVKLADARLAALSQQYADLSLLWKSLQKYIARAVTNPACLVDPNLQALKKQVLDEETRLIEQQEIYLKGNVDVDY